jgi:spore coat protein CotF
MQHNNSSMNDKEHLQDLLSAQKYLTENYNNCVSECQDILLRNDLLAILKEEHDIQNEVFQIMFHRGWCTLRPADQCEINTAKQKFIGMM